MAEAYEIEEEKAREAREAKRIEEERIQAEKAEETRRIVEAKRI